MTLRYKGIAFAIAPQEAPRTSRPRWRFKGKDSGQKQRVANEDLVAVTTTRQPALDRVAPPSLASTPLCAVVALPPRAALRWVATSASLSWA